MTTFYRLHCNPAAPTFASEHAYSGVWGGEWTADGSQNECRSCIPGDRDDCRTCGGTGWEDALPGYSCCWTADDLIAYVREHVGLADNSTDAVVIFEGRQVGTGFDGEPLAVPTGHVEWITWADLVARTAVT